ncbi:MAG: nucleotide exchange factor GrpE [Nitrospiraceae bacterium]|nr:MAG: nucleotide exchange factor GrpE [Nitrospiraceae bacterium]
MSEEFKKEIPGIDGQNENEQQSAMEAADAGSLKKSLSEINDKYVRLYAEFENFKRFTAKQKEEQLKYANESLLKDLLTVIDHLDLALQHSSNNETSSALAEGVELTLKELRGVLEKYGLAGIEALGKQFDPTVHDAMTQIESEDAEENTIIKEFRKGYTFKDRVIRASLVGVAKRPAHSEKPQNQTVSRNEN